jgi:beta-lactamase class A
MTLPLLTRRAALSGAAASLVAACATPRSQNASSFERRLAEIEAGTGGRIGVFARDTGSGRTLAHRADERFATASTFKAPLAAAVLARIDAGDFGLDRRVPLTQADILAYAPVASKHVAEGSMSVTDLLGAMVGLSDNTAANLLLPLVGGPAGFTHWLRSIGDSETRLDRTEPELNTNIPGDARDTTTPRVMAATLERIALGDVLSEASRRLLVGWMETSPTGKARLRAGFPADWRTADKTGSGMNGAANVIALTWPPNRPPLVVASYMSDSALPTATLNAAHAAIARLIADWTQS